MSKIFTLVLFLFVACSELLNAQHTQHLYSWGRSDEGQLGDGIPLFKRSPYQSGKASDWTSLSTGLDHSLGIKADGTLWTWGKGKIAPVQVGNTSDWVSISAGAFHNMAIKADGTLWAWGRNGTGQLGDGSTTDKASPVQIGSTSDWVSISTGEFHSVALKTDGTLWAWGRNNSGQLGDGTTTDKTTPVQVGSTSDWASISGGAFHSMAIKIDGTLWAWGRNGTGQLGDGTTMDKTTPVQIGSTSDWVLISAANYFYSDGKSLKQGTFTIGIKADGTLWGWGENYYGQLGDGRAAPVQITNNSDWKSVSSGESHTLGIKEDGTLWAWGTNNYGQLGDSTTTKRIAPVQIGTASDWSSVATWLHTSVAIKTDGTLWAWGYNKNGFLGDGTTTNRTAPVQIGNSSDWASVAIGNYHFVALKTNGTLWTWGDNRNGQLGDGTTTSSTAQAQVGSDTDWAIVSAGDYHSFGIKTDGTLWGWGTNNYGQLGDGTTTNRTSPVQIGSAYWASISAKAQHTAGIKTDGTLWTWGYNYYGQLGDGTTTSRTTPDQIGGTSDWASVSTGSRHSVAIKTNGTLWAWGNNHFGQLGDGALVDSFSPRQIGKDISWASVSAGKLHTAALQYSSTASSPTINKPQAGSHSARNVEIDFFLPITAKPGTVQLTFTQTEGTKDPYSPHIVTFEGTETAGQHKIFLDAKNLSASKGVKSVSSAPNDALVSETKYAVTISYQNQESNIARSEITEGFSFWDNGLWAWGGNGGAFGDGTTISRYTPGRADTSLSLTAIASGLFHRVSIKKDGTLWTCGSNVYGQLGDGTTVNKLTPVQVGTDTDWAFINPGHYYTLAIKKDGTLWGWGRNHAGQLGNGTTWDKHTPVQAGTDSNWAFVSGGFLHSLGVKKDGTLWSWGHNNYGQLGDGTTSSTSKPNPTQIGPDTDWASVNAGRYHSMALKKDGTLWAWGHNYYGQLGDGTTISQNTPVQVGTGTDWATINAGPHYNIAVKKDGTLWAWGDNLHGALGDGTTINRHSPVQISTIKGWTLTALGNAHSIAILNYHYIPTSVPSKPILSAISDTGLSNTDGITTDNTPEFTGSAEANNLVSIYINDIAVASVTADANGNWSYTIAEANALTDGTYQVKITTTDTEGNESTSSAVLIIIIDKQPPTVFSKNISIGLDANGNAVIAAQDIDNGSTDNISSAANLLFSLSRIAFGCADKGQNLEVTLSVTDEAGNSATGIATVTVEDNVAPIIKAGQAFAIDENSAADSTVGAIVATDNCSMESFSISAGNTGDAFAIDAAGSLTVNNAAALDYETSPEFTLTITAADGTGNSSFQTVSIGLNNLNDNAPVIAASQSFRLDENAAADTTVGTVSASDADGATTYSNWTIVSGNEAGAFAIDTSTGAITVADASVLDYETTSSFTLAVSVSDGANTSATEEVVVNLNNANDNAPVAGNATISINENAANGTAVHTIAASDADADGDALTYSITAGNTGNAFALDATTGAITVADASGLDYEAVQQFVLTVEVSDGTITTNASITVNLNNLNDNAPILATLSDVAGNELEPISFTATATDADNMGELQYSLAEGAPAGASIDASTGTFNWTPTEEQGPALYTISVIVSDGESRSTQEVTVTVNEVNQAPVFTSTPVALAKEGEEYFYQLTATDADLPANTLTYEAVETPSWLRFDAATQTLSGTPDKTAEVSNLIRLQVSDGQEISTQEFPLEVEITTGLFDKEKQEHMLVYPNPTKGRLIIELGNIPAEEKATVSLLSLEGRLLIQENGSLQKGAETISTYLEGAKMGTYLLQVKTKNSTSSIKVMKE